MMRRRYGQYRTELVHVRHGARPDVRRREAMMSRDISGGWFIDVARKRAALLIPTCCAEHAPTSRRTRLRASYGLVVQEINRMGTRTHEPFVRPLLEQRQST